MVQRVHGTKDNKNVCSALIFPFLETSRHQELIPDLRRRGGSTWDEGPLEWSIMIIVNLHKNAGLCFYSYPCFVQNMTHKRISIESPHVRGLRVNNLLTIPHHVSFWGYYVRWVMTLVPFRKWAKAYINNYKNSKRNGAFIMFEDFVRRKSVE